MASSGSFNTSAYSGRYLQFSWSIKKQDIANNKTTISWTLKGAGGNSQTWYKSGNFKVVINGSTVYSSATRIQLWSGTVVASGEAVIPHNSDGTKTFSASAEAGIYTVAVNCRGSGSWALTAIPRTATVTSGTDFNDEGNPTIAFNNPGGYSLQPYLNFYDSNDNRIAQIYATKGNYSSPYTWSLTDAQRNTLRSTLANLKSCRVQEGLDTYNGNTKLGYSSVAKTFTIANANPSIGIIAYKDNNSSTVNITQDNQQIIRNKSILYFTFSNLQALKSATLSKVSVTINGVTKTTDLSGTSMFSVNLNFGTINVASNINASIVITDSRGNTTTYSKEIQVLDYQSPYSTITCARENNFYTETNLKVNCTYSSLDGKNDITIQYQTKKVSDADYGALTTIENNTDYEIQLDNTYQWNVKVITTDSVGTIVSYILFVDRGIPLVFFDRLKKSTGFNAIPNYDNSVEVDGRFFIENQDILDKFTGIGGIAKAALTSSWNDACGNKTGIFMGSNMSNAPDNSSNWFFVLNMVHNDKYQRQLAFDFFSINIWTRRMDNGNWDSSWTRVL